mmetsp:Transcript_50814/g.128150  ORF Transcript_50814/g.128150 Transcript_50814/m.128150 type:complete len:215 (+) Transcript_50814:593-1237(+)
MAAQAHECPRLRADHFAVQRVPHGQIQVDVLQDTDLAFQDHLPHALRHRVARGVGALHEDAAEVLGGPLRDHGLARVAAHRRLAEDVLAGLEGLDRPLAPHRRRQHVVHRVDLRVRQHLVKAGVGLGDAPRLGARLGLGLLQRGQANYLDTRREVRVRLHRLHHREGHVPRGAEDAQTKTALCHAVGGPWCADATHKEQGGGGRGCHRSDWRCA